MQTYNQILAVSEVFFSNFKPGDYIDRKVNYINKWMERNRLDAVVLGVSGGIDSAVCYKLIELAMKRPDSPIKRFSALSIPITDSKGTTGQSEAVRLAKLLDSNIEVIGIGAAARQMAEALAVSEDPFARGQLDYWLRPAMLYGETARLRSLGYSAVVCGTINASEKFLGFYGKHTDVCDFCPITDLVKSRVFKVAEVLGVPQEIIDAKPSGGVYSGETDEELIGATYADIEAYMYMISGGIALPEGVEAVQVIRSWRDRNSFKFLRPLNTVEL